MHQEEELCRRRPTKKPRRTALRGERSLTSEITLLEDVTQTSGVLVNLVVFLTVNHRGPLPSRELHSTDETRVWRDHWGLEPVYHLFTCTCEVTLPRTVTHMTSATKRTRIEGEKERKNRRRKKSLRSAKDIKTT